MQICYTKLACKAVGVFCNANDDILGANGSAIFDVDTDITESWCESKMISKKGTCRLTLPSRWWPRYLRFRSKKPLTNVREVKNKRGKTNKKTRCKKRYVLNSLRVAAPYPDKEKTDRRNSPPSPFILSQTSKNQSDPK